MKLFLLNLSLAFLSGIIMQSFAFPILLAGFLAGYIFLWFMRPLMPRSRYCEKFPKVVGFICYVLWSLILSSLKVARAVLSFRPRLTPGIVAIPIELKTDLAIFIMANAITLTPGTLSLRVSDDKKTLYVHGMFIDDPNDFRKDIRSTFERKVSEFLR